ncbi:hypothetical protein BLHB2_25770 [Bacillus licheniformis]|nr:hypothetical protein BLHB2_25770 [Bacillus licheniformis]GIN32164.1 hypothetical protein J2TS5_42030 [Bacillus licheniformis]
MKVARGERATFFVFKNNKRYNGTVSPKNVIRCSQGDEHVESSGVKIYLGTPKCTRREFGGYSERLKQQHDKREAD